jgi:lipopolysaccharide/colanic/teichoic acid biosynthesis glycosyltransferase
LRLSLTCVPTLLGLDASPAADRIPAPRSVSLPRYFKAKRVIDCGVAGSLLALALPLFLTVALVALGDVGSPAFFWQRRVGRYGRTFLLLKVRTLRAPFDRKGDPRPEHARLSATGRFLRKTHLDEFPQLVNVLVGDMSLIGPRPLLPEDQPSDAGLRLAVRPGITGWAQVNGGTLLTPAEKGRLDDWYVRNASLLLDLKIALLTLRALWRGQQRSDEALARAHGDWQGPTGAATPSATGRMEWSPGGGEH